MFCHEPTNVESFGARAVNVVQIERRWIRIGDSKTKRLDSLVPVTRPIKEGFELWAGRLLTKGPGKHRQMGDGRQGQRGRRCWPDGHEGRQTVKRRGSRP